MKLFREGGIGLRSDVVSETSRRRTVRGQALRRMKHIADCRVNDAVKLAFLDSGLEPEQLAVIDGLELGALTEFKRNSTGGVEIKLVDRLAALERLAALGQEGEREQAEEFFLALERRAGAEHEA